MAKDPLLIYEHGAGNQTRQTAAELKAAYDLALFGGPGPSEAVTWWQVFWDRPGGPAKEAQLDKVIEGLAAKPSRVPGADAAVLLEAIRVARPPRKPRRKKNQAEAVGENTTADALNAIDGCFASAQSLQGPEEMPDIIFRLLAGQASKDVVPYLYDGWAARMREPVKKRVRELGKDQPVVILAHSLGTILAYDVVTDAEFASWSIQLFVTAGSPLGIKNVVQKVRDRQGPGPMPATVTGWQNFHDARDKVGWFGETLAGKYPVPPPLTQKLDVLNEAPNHHDLTGYLVDSDLRKAVRAAVKP
jgi:hypothetical protein